MKVPFSIIAWTLCVLPPAAADPIYQCIRNGTAVFTDKPAEASCRLMELDVLEPDPAEVARIQEKKRADAERERAEYEQAAREQWLKSQVEAARAAARQSDAERRLAERQARGSRQPVPNGYYSPGYYYGPSYPGYWPGHPPEPGLRPNPPAFNPPEPPPAPPAPGYPYAPGRATVGGH